MLGLRLYFQKPHEQSWPTDGTMDWLWPAAERAGVPIAMKAESFLPALGRIAERHPGLKLAVDHMAVPSGGRGVAAYRHHPELLDLDEGEERPATAHMTVYVYGELMRPKDRSATLAEAAALIERAGY